MPRIFSKLHSNYFMKVLRYALFAFMWVGYWPTISAQLHMVHLGTPNAYEYGNSLTVLPDGSTVVCAIQYKSPTTIDVNAGDALLIKVSSANKIIWAKKLSSSRRDKFTKATYDADGNIYACGYVDLEHNSANGTGFVIKMDADGNIIWQKDFPNGMKGSFINDVVVLSNGNIALAGNSSSYYNESNALLIVLTPKGELVLSKNYDLAFNGYPTKGDGLEKIVEYNGRIYALGIGRGQGSEFHNLFTMEIDTVDGSVKQCREYEYDFKNSSLSYNCSYPVDFYIRDGKLIMSASNTCTFDAKDGCLFNILHVDLGNNYSTRVDWVMQWNKKYTSQSSIYPLSDNDYFSAYSNHKRMLVPEEDHSGINVTEIALDRMVDFNFPVAMTKETNGVNSFNKLDVNLSKNRLYGVGMSEKSFNQIGLLDILLMKTDIKLTKGNGCSMVEDTLGRNFTYFTPRISDPPSGTFKGIRASGLPISDMPFSTYSKSHDTLGVKSQCIFYTDSFVYDSFCKGMTYLLPNGKTIKDSGTFLVDTLVIKDTSYIKLYFKVSQYPKLLVDAGKDVSVCLGDSIRLHATGSGLLTWDNGIKNDVSFYTSNDLMAIVTASDHFGCKSNDSVNIKVHPLPNVDAGLSRHACYNMEIVLKGSGAKTYKWDHGVSDNIPFRFTQTTLYKVIGTDEYGCKNTDSVWIELDTIKTIFIPNSFSPNNDHFNDYYSPKGVGFELLHMSVYDRWGIVLYENDGEFAGWDGTYQGFTVPEGIYLVRMKYRFCSQIIYKSFTITVLR